ncbi:MAG: hypothetical protein PHP79_07245, partial [Clostridia bacterium]|nr:hypothetical protein [Clostridia bacterium]
IVGITLALLKPETISKILGNSSGAFGVLVSAVLGSIAMMPTFVAFSTGDMLLKSGAGIAQIAALISTLTLIGIITIPMESKCIGKKATLYRKSDHVRPRGQSPWSAYISSFNTHFEKNAS